MSQPLTVPSEKNRLLRQGNAKQLLQATKIIRKPKGSIGSSGYSLITEMKLNKDSEKDRNLYSDILVRLSNHFEFQILTIGLRPRHLSARSQSVRVLILV